MKQILKLIVAILFMAIAVNSYATKNEDITLIVTSDGATKDEAIKNALRNAIEQTYGVFVSANTDIFNDEVVSDEIATVASGNIKSYKELSTSQSDGKTTVTLEAIVSIGKLVSYAKSKGAECEFDGAAMYADIELQELYRKNEEHAIDNLITQIKNNLNNGFDYTLNVSRLSHMEQQMYSVSKDPTPVDNDFQILNVEIEIKLNKQGEDAWKIFMDALKLLGDYRGVDGKHYYGGKITNIAKAMFGKGGTENMNGSSEFPYHVSIPEAKVGNIGPNLYLDSYASHFNLRSQKSVLLITDFIDNFIKSVNDFTIVDNMGEHISLDNLGFANSNSLDSRLSLENTANYFNKKNGKRCAKLKAILLMPNDKLKQLSKLKIQHN